LFDTDISSSREAIGQPAKTSHRLFLHSFSCRHQTHQKIHISILVTDYTNHCQVYPPCRPCCLGVVLECPSLLASLLLLLRSYGRLASQLVVLRRSETNYPTSNCISAFRPKSTILPTLPRTNQLFLWVCPERSLLPGECLIERIKTCSCTST